MTCRALRYCADDIGSEQMATTLTLYNIVPEMNTATFNCKHLPLNKEVPYFFLDFSICRVKVDWDISIMLAAVASDSTI